MKHPIFYRVVFYGCLVFLGIMVMILSNSIKYAPFKATDMRSAYFHGCNFASKPLTDSDVEMCRAASDVFKETLDDLDRQMSK